MTFRIIFGRMIQRYLILVGMGLCLFGIDVATAATTFAVRNVALYQPNDVLVARLGYDAAPLASYVKQIEVREATVFANASSSRGISGAIVMAIKPGRQSRAWLVLGANHLPAALATRIKSEAEAVFPVSVRLGPIAVAIVFDAWGGGQPVTDPAHPAPIPLEWRGALAPEVLPDGPLSRAWP